MLKRMTTVSTRETVYHHDDWVMLIVETGSLNDTAWSWWYANEVHSIELRLRLWRPWLLFDTPAFPLGFGALSSTSRCDFACLHELTDI